MYKLKCETQHNLLCTICKKCSNRQCKNATEQEVLIQRHGDTLQPHTVAACSSQLHSHLLWENPWGFEIDLCNGCTKMKAGGGGGNMTKTEEKWNLCMIIIGKIQWWKFHCFSDTQDDNERACVFFFILSLCISCFSASQWKLIPTCCCWSFQTRRCPRVQWTDACL